MSGFGWRVGALTALTVALGAIGCAPPDPEILGAEEEIVGGTIERGRPEVVFIYNLAGAGCTGAVIGPRVVLTAKHCVQAFSGGELVNRLEDPSRIRVYVGTDPSSFTAEYRVSEVAAAPGSWDLRDASDVGIIVLSGNARETPMAVSLDNPVALTGEDFTAVGYGQTPSGSSGTKYTVTGTVRQVISGALLEVRDPTICQGDSGGPLIAQDGRIWGVVSFGDNRSCGSAIGYYNGLSHLRSFLAPYLEGGPVCTPTGVESCDGIDNDCDESVDEGCMPIGSPCASDNECIGGTCAETAAGRICTSACDPMRPALGCSPGFYCGLVPGSCAGYCVPGGAGGVSYGQSCASNTDCASLFCVDPGDGNRRCLAPCQGDTGACLADEVCAAGAGACNACVPQEIVNGTRSIGEPCALDSECAGGICYAHGGIRECSRACAADSDCGERFECRTTPERGALCIRDRRQGAGGACETSEDCLEGICASQGGRSWCTTVCASDDDCLSSFSCVDAGGTSVCAPDGGLIGESCEAGCVTGFCALVGGVETCSAACGSDDACPVGFNCVRVGDGAACVEAYVPPTTRGGCAVTSPAAPHPSRRGVFALGLLGLALAAWIARRKFEKK